MSFEREIMEAVAWADIVVQTISPAIKFLAGFAVGILIFQWRRRKPK